MKKKAKYVLAGAVVVVLVLVLTYNILRPITVNTLVVEPTTAVLYFEEQGFVRYNVHTVHSLVGGRLLSVNVQEGQTVAAGDILAVVDSSHLNYEMEQIQMNNLAHQVQIDSISDADAGASEHLNSMRQHLNALIESGNLAIANLERMISESTIVSSVSGTIINLNVNTTNVLDIALPVAEIMTFEDSLIEVFVSTADIGMLQLGDKVDIIIGHQGREVLYTGTIHSIGVRAEAMLSVLGIEERRVKVLITPDEESGALISGFEVDVRFIVYYAENQISVPRTAVFTQDGLNMVYLVDGGRATAVPVQLGQELRTEHVVVSGLSYGEIIIRNAHQEGLSNGIRVLY